MNPPATKPGMNTGIKANDEPYGTAIRHYSSHEPTEADRWAGDLAARLAVAIRHGAFGPRGLRAAEELHDLLVDAQKSATSGTPGRGVTR